MGKGLVQSLSTASDRKSSQPGCIQKGAIEEERLQAQLVLGAPSASVPFPGRFNALFPFPSKQMNAYCS